MRRLLSIKDSSNKRYYYYDTCFCVMVYAIVYKEE